jgi:hypothetical protein
MKNPVPSDIAQNVFLDPSSTYTWESLDESHYLKQVLEKLREEMRGDFENFRFYIFSSREINDNLPFSAYLPENNKILIYTSDENSRYPQVLSPCYHSIFKSYLPYEISRSNIHSFPVGLVNDVPQLTPTPISQRPIDVFFRGQLTSNRIPLYRALIGKPKREITLTEKIKFKLLKEFLRITNKDFTKNLNSPFTPFKTDINFNYKFKSGLTPTEYGQILNQSKVVLCPKGWKSSETFRHLEAARAGSIVITEELPQTRLYQSSPFLTVKTWEEGITKTKDILNDKNQQEEISMATIKWYEETCSPKAIANHMKKCLKKQ